jgi:hypothetical protein
MQKGTSTYKNGGNEGAIGAALSMDPTNLFMDHLLIISLEDIINKLSYLATEI